MGAFTELSKFFSKGIVNQAQTMGYSEDNILILLGDLSALQRRFPKTYQNLMSCSYHRDRRTPIEYGQDLVASWLFEDSLVQSLSNCGLEVSLSGADCNREILYNANVSSNSDCLITFNGISVQLEIMCDYKGYWERAKRIDLRDGKYQKLCNTRSLFLGVSIPTTSYILLDFGGNVTANYIPSHFPYGGKPAYSVPVSSNAFRHLDIIALAERIKQLI